MIEEMIKGYRPVAVRDDFAGNTVVSFNTETRKFLLSVSGKLMGPIDLDEIKALLENLKDIVEMKGHYNYIKEYDVQGNKTL